MRAEHGCARRRAVLGTVAASVVPAAFGRRVQGTSTETILVDSDASSALTDRAARSADRRERRGGHMPRLLVAHEQGLEVGLAVNAVKGNPRAALGLHRLPACTQCACRRHEGRRRSPRARHLRPGGPRGRARCRRGLALLDARTPTTAMRKPASACVLASRRTALLCGKFNPVERSNVCFVASESSRCIDCIGSLWRALHSEESL